MKVSIGTPCYGQLEPQFVVSLIDTISLLRARGHRASWGYLSSSLTHCARNSIAAVQLEEGSDVCVQIDSDQTWEAEDLLEAIEFVTVNPEAVVGFPVRARTPMEEDGVIVESSLPVSDSLWVSPRLLAGEPLRSISFMDVSFIEVASVGGLLVYSRSCLEQLSKEAELDELGRPALFDLGQKINGRRVGEDVYFCERWRAAGGNVFVHSTAVVGHIGKITYVGDFNAEVLNFLP